MCLPALAWLPAACAGDYAALSPAPHLALATEQGAPASPPPDGKTGGATLSGLTLAAGQAADVPDGETDGAPGEITANQPTRIALIVQEDPAAAHRTPALDQAVRIMLADLGYRLVTPPPAVAPHDRIYFVSTRLAVAPARGGESIAIEWLVADAAGEPVGRISQARTLPAGAGAAEWRRQAELAAAAAAESIAQLAPRPAQAAQ